MQHLMKNKEYINSPEQDHEVKFKHVENYNKEWQVQCYKYHPCTVVIKPAGPGHHAPFLCVNSIHLMQKKKPDICPEKKF